MQIQVIMNVDEEAVKKAAENDNLTEAINTELGWIIESGLEAIEWQVVREEK